MRRADIREQTHRRLEQLRLFLHAGAYWMMWGPRMANPAVLALWEAQNAVGSIALPAPGTTADIVTIRSRQG